MEQRKRRVYQPGSDQEYDCQYDEEEGTQKIAQMIQCAHGSTRSQVKSVIEKRPMRSNRT